MTTNKKNDILQHVEIRGNPCFSVCFPGVQYVPISHAVSRHFHNTEAAVSGKAMMKEHIVHKA